MKKIILIASLLVCSNSWGTCYYPKMNFSIPNGATATMEDMVIAQSSFKAYKAEMDAYLVCLDDELAKVPKYLDDYYEIRSLSDDKYNAAVDELTANSEKWNQNVRAYNGEPSKSTPRVVKSKPDKEKPNNNKLLEISSGTGFFISKNGHFISNNHVVDICRELKTKRNGVIYQARIIATDEVNDLALGKVNISNSDYLEFSLDGGMLGEDIIVSGFPFQRQLSESVKITKGVISSLSGPGNNYSVMQIDAAVQPGNSGGPILNNKAELVGVTVAKADAEVFYEMSGSIPENVNFGIKVETVRPFVKANNIRINSWSFSSGKALTSVEIAEIALNTTIHLQCWNTLAALREMSKTNKVRNLLIDID